MSPNRDAELFAKLDLLVELSRAMDRRLQSVEREVAEIKGRIADMPTARDFGRLEGRVAEMSQRLPTTLGYAQPKPAA